MKRYSWLFLIIIIAAVLRLANITSVPPGLYPDEAMNGNNALEVLGTVPFGSGFKVFYPENNGREGLFINIQSVFLQIFKVHEPWVLRLPSVIFGILTVLGIYFLARELFRNNPKSEIIALLAAFLLATSFWHINFSRIAFRAITAPFFLTWSIYFLLLAFHKIKESRPIKVGILYAFISGALYGLGFNSYIAYRGTPLIILFILGWFFFSARKENWKKQFYTISLVFIIFSFVVFLPLGIYFLNNPGDFFGRTSQISIFNSETPLRDLTVNILKTAGMFNFVGDWNWRHNIAGKPELFWPVGILFITGFIYGIKMIKKESAIVMLFLWFAVAALPVIISNESQPHALRAILTLIPVFIFAAFGGLKIYEYIKQRIRPAHLKAALFVFFITLIIEACSSYFIVWARNSNTAAAFSKNYVEIGRVINSLPQERPKFVVVNMSGVEVRGIPMPAQTIMFITDSFGDEKRQKKNIRYLLPDELNQINIPKDSSIFYLE